MCSSLLRGLSTFVGWFVSEKAQIEIRSVKTPYFVLTGVACGWGGGGWASVAAVPNSKVGKNYILNGKYCAQKI